MGRRKVTGVISTETDADAIVDQARLLCGLLEQLDETTRIDAINSIRLELHKVSPLRDEPVDCIQWVRAEHVQANDYNPNAVAPPEMKLLEISILQDGYTQPIVTFLQDGDTGIREVVDGFHRNRVGRECKEVAMRIRGYLPVVTINSWRKDRSDRIAATIRHNRARGKHQITAMAEIVLELRRRNWTKEKIGRELGMDPDEVLRLSQITGLAEMFADREFSTAWEAGAGDGVSIDETDALDDATNQNGNSTH